MENNEITYLLKKKRELEDFLKGMDKKQTKTEREKLIYEETKRKLIQILARMDRV